jgi:hypothetical protein
MRQELDHHFGRQSTEANGFNHVLAYTEVQSSRRQVENFWVCGGGFVNLLSPDRSLSPDRARNVRQRRQGEQVLSRLAARVSTIGAVARYGPPDDFHNQRTQYRNYGAGEHPPVGEQPPPGEPPTTDEPPPQTAPEQYEPDGDPFDQETEPTAWYRKPVVLIGWALSVLILIALIVYGITELLKGQQGTGNIPSTSTTAPTSTTTTSPTTTATTTPPTSSAVEPPAQQPTQQQPQQQPTQQQPTHRHHLPQLPSVITIPGGPTMTVPPALR